MIKVVLGLTLLLVAALYNCYIDYKSGEYIWFGLWCFCLGSIVTSGLSAWFLKDMLHD